MPDLVSKFESLSLTVPERGPEQAAYEAQWRSVLQTGQVQAKLGELNLFLRDHSFVAGTERPLRVDAELFEAVLPVTREVLAASKDVREQCGKHRHVIRWAKYLQELLDVPEAERVLVDEAMELPREVIEKKKKEAKGEVAAAPAGGKGKAEDKAEGKAARGKPDEATLARLREEAKAKKAAKKAAGAQQQQQQAAAPAKTSPGMIDFRVGFIQKAIKHPDADALYVSTIDLGEPEGPRTVCSGLAKHIPLEEMQQRHVVVVCNLKPVNMRGIKSAAMVLCGSSDGKVELVIPPANSAAGDKVFFEGYGDEEPLKQLNPKKKIWEQEQPHFTTTADLEVAYKDDSDAVPLRKLTNARGETFKVSSLAHAHVS
ncbi:AFL032Cp [Eremothecium gossypii ATCC 10895]|uniref:AFL032Cp n=1 Tax=Eremothecium gossypii (strain ATCC 10895 / CBS 109.51 / FGSC 9923 / NRRL Y-1056) TaxID=284811 RepID=Q754V3_EREGS|nr:AFL032Cp [Eremothecium gossypii ATCC 10895]AAS53340.1 AFL032Cp [Eremothecium gossypii ATCC 10895]